MQQLNGIIREKADNGLYTFSASIEKEDLDVYNVVKCKLENLGFKFEIQEENIILSWYQCGLSELFHFANLDLLYI